MLNETDFERWLDKNDFMPGTRKLIQRVRSSEPVRLAKSGRKNIAGRYPSKKMGRTIQFESHKNELAGIYEYENDETVLEYWDQPSSFTINYHNAAGRYLGTTHTPDFLVLREDGAGWEEFKTDEELRKLEEDYPDRYQLGDDGVWRSPAGEKAAAEYGLTYRVRASSEINWKFVRNCVFLEDYLRGEEQTIDESSRTVIMRIVSEQPGITLSDLLNEAALENADDLYLMILFGEVFFDVHDEVLGEPEIAHIYPDRRTADAMRLIQARRRVPAGEPPMVSIEPGASISWDGNLFSVKHIGYDSVWLADPCGEIIPVNCDTFEQLVSEGAVKQLSSMREEAVPNNKFSIIQKASPKDLDIAQKRLQIIAPIMANRSSAGPLSRTQFRWIEAYRSHELLFGDGYLGLIPRHSDKGNATPRIPESKELAYQVIEDEYLTHRQPTMKSAHLFFKERCKDEGLPVASYETFCKLIRDLPEYEKTKARMGRRAAYNHEPFYWELEFTTPRHVERPFEIGHIDHTELDLEYRDPKTGRNLGRAWLTLMLDAYTRRILAYILSFRPPSYRSLMMVMRECVRRHGRLPQTLVVDGGKEFHGTDMELLCARYLIIKKNRRSARGRDGSVLERLFGTVNKEVIYNLEGNTQITKHVRIMTKSFDPKGHAVWTLERFHQYFSFWAYEIYDTQDHPALGQSPREAFLEGLRTGGKRLSRMIVYDESFILETLPILRDTGSKVHSGKGVKINNVYYWCDEFRNSRYLKERIVVKYDPFDIGIAYAYVNNKWTLCRSEYYSVFQGKSHAEIKAIGEEIVTRYKNLKKAGRAGASQLAAFLLKARKEEEFLDAELKALEDKAVQPLMPASMSILNQDASKQPIGPGDHEPKPPEINNSFLDEYDYVGEMKS